MRHAVALAVVLVAGPPACGGTIRSDRPDRLFTDLAARPEFDPVGRFTWTEAGSGFLASGSLIRDDWVLTAAHVIDGTNGVGGGVSNLQFEVGGETYSGVEWIPHPAWAASGGESNLFAGWDIGLVRLDRGVDNVDPARLFNDRDELGRQSTLVGFGATGTGETGATQPGGTKRAGNNTVDVVGGAQTAGSDPRFRFGHDRLIAVDFDDPNNPFESTLGDSGALDLEYLTAPGDSGGGLFLEVDGEQRLAGVTSLGSTVDFNGANSDYGDRASFTRVSSFLDWIEGIVGPLAEAIGPQPGDFNADGLVDAADFVVARDTGGADDDFAEFAERFSPPSGGAAGGGGVTAGAFSVPEPAAGAAMLAAVGLASVLVPARRRP